MTCYFGENNYKTNIRSCMLVLNLCYIIIMQSSDPSGQHRSYLQTQFFFYMLPSYYAIIAFLVRYHFIIKHPKQRNAPSVPAQSLVLFLQNQPSQYQSLPSDSAPPSYLIKSKLCLLNSYIFILMFVLGLLGNQTIFYASIIYLIGFMSWSLAALLLRREYQRKIGQSLWTHRFFFIFSGTFAITKMFEDYLLPMNIFFNSISLASNLILIVYGLYRPEDNSTIVLLHDSQLPSFIKWFFQNLQLNELVRKIFSIQDTIIRQQREEWDEELEAEDIKEIEQSFKISPKIMKEEINLLNTLPRRNVFVDKKIRYLKGNKGVYKYYYFIFTQIGVSRFQVERTFQEFEELQTDLINVFNEKNFPNLSLPRLPKTSQTQTFNYSQSLEMWLTEILKTPIFMIKPLLQFLNIDVESSAPFLIYFESTHKSFCSKAYVVACLKRRKGSRDIQTRIGYYQEERETVQKQFLSSMKEKCVYQIQICDESTNSKEYGFWMMIKPENKELESQKWKIVKTEENLFQLNQKIEEQCKISVSFFYRLTSKSHGQHYKKKAQSYLEYLNQLLSNQKYFCFSLFQFIKFNPIILQPKLLTRAQFSSTTLPQTDRTSHYMEEFEDQGNFIQIIRVDKIDKDIFEFKVRRKGLTLKKKSDDFIRLRKQLAEVYTGVGFVAEINWSRCNKREAKQRGEQFLVKIEKLPKIAINECYLNFYENSL